MGRNQITIYAKAEIVALVREHEIATGASATRILTAALLQYFLSEREGPDPAWIARAVRLAKGQVTINDLRKELAG